MKISIDTKEDSPEEIAKAIKMLQSLIGERESYPQAVVEQAQAAAFTNMFGDTPVIQDAPKPSASELLDEKDNEEDLPGAHQLIPY
jgi:hypothetical protein